MTEPLSAAVVTALSVGFGAGGVVAASGGDFYIRLGAFAGATLAVLALLRSIYGAKAVRWITKHWHDDAERRRAVVVQEHVEAGLAPTITVMTNVAAQQQAMVGDLHKLEELYGELRVDVDDTTHATKTSIIEARRDRQHVWRAIGRLEGRMNIEHFPQPALSTEDLLDQDEDDFEDTEL